MLGILLGVFPLFISAIEHYEDILGPFRRYRHFTSKAQRICDELETERAIFYAECRLLLELVAPREAAIDMMEDLDHSLWRDAGLSEKLAREFGSLGTPCKTTISRINGKLVEIDNKTKALVNELGQPTSVSSRAMRIQSALR